MLAGRLILRVPQQRALAALGRRASTATAAEPSGAVAAWSRLQKEADDAKFMSKAACPKRSGIGTVLSQKVLQHDSLAEGLATTLAVKLRDGGCAGLDYFGMFTSAYEEVPELAEAAAADLERFLILDPAADGYLRIYLFFKGFHCVQAARVANFYWNLPGGGGRWFASALQSDMSNRFGVDIHPGATWGRGITMDHGTGCVIGETAVIGDNVYLMHDVTLGATGTSTEHDRHPKIGRGAFLAAKCTVLGNIEVGANATIAAHALVNKPVPPGHLAVGVPAKMILQDKSKPKVAPSGQVIPTETYLNVPGII